MRHFFSLAGRPSTDFDCWIATSNLWDGVERDVETITIPGRNGTLLVDNGRYNNFSAEINAYIPHNMKTNVDGLRAWLTACTGYARYMDTTHPEEFRLVRFSGPFSVDASDRVGASVVIEFDCKPQRFLLSGEAVKTYTAAGTIANPTGYTARPLIRAYGTGNFTINGVKVTISAANTYTDIDCDLEEAYKGTANCNGNITLNNAVFPTLTPGVNNISMSGITRLEITPRWWTA